MYKIVFFVPVEHAEITKDALFKVGAGKQDNYECCAWQTKGMGQFRPLAGSTPFIGNQDELTIVEEVRIEVICKQEKLTSAISALKKAHPYESPVIDIYKLEDLIY